MTIQDCPNGSDLGVCDIATEGGVGLGNFLSGIQTPLIVILVALGIVGAIVLFMTKLSNGLGKKIGGK